MFIHLINGTIGFDPWPYCVNLGFFGDTKKGNKKLKGHSSAPGTSMNFEWANYIRIWHIDDPDQHLRCVGSSMQCLFGIIWYLKHQYTIGIIMCVGQSTYIYINY